MSKFFFWLAGMLFLILATVEIFSPDDTASSIIFYTSLMALSFGLFFEKKK